MEWLNNEWILAGIVGLGNGLGRETAVSHLDIMVCLGGI
jgi:hypothetical protein